MRYWWVNQNQTYSHEVGGGYLWSPKTNANGARNQFYENMVRVERGDIVFSFASTEIGAVGVASGPAFSAVKPTVFGQAGHYWNQEGWQVPVEFTKMPRPIQPKNHMALIAPLLPEKYSPLQPSGKGLQGVYLAEIPQELGQLLLGLLDAPPLTMEAATLSEISEISVAPEDQQILADVQLEETVKATLVMARRGQGIFRQRVRLMEESCRVTGVSSEKLLIASHIKPWTTSDNLERLDGNNGLFLSPHVDKLFNDGFISFTDKGKLLVSPLLDSDVLQKWHIDTGRGYGKFNSDQAYFLRHHNEEISKQVS
jgi:hypothetical protein